MPYVDVILPLALEKRYTYRISQAQTGMLQRGMRVAVPFKRDKLYTAIVDRIHNEAPIAYEARDIDQILEKQAMVEVVQLDFWKWIANYYMCTMGEVMRAAIPGALLLESETVILKREGSAIEEDQLNDAEFQIHEALQHRQRLKVKDVVSLLERKRVLPVLHGMMAKGAIELKETLSEKYRPKWVQYVRIAPEYASDKALEVVLDTLNRAPKQRELILSYYQHRDPNLPWIAQSKLIKSSGIGSGVINALVNKGIFERRKIREDRIQWQDDATTRPLIELNAVQIRALSDVHAHWKQGKVSLLHGVTASGKTEIYIKLIEEQLDQGKQVLYLVPEIALTAQLIRRLQQHFGASVSVYHSRYSQHERVEVWNNVLHQESKADVVLGTRSALFLPFKNLGLIVVDEEHDPSYKQMDPAPRYHGRDAAIVLARSMGSYVVLGSATPSVTSYHNSKSGKYGYTQIPTRFSSVQMPAIELVDLRHEHRRKTIRGHFSAVLFGAITQTLEQKEQVILFQNRRGYSPIVECYSCGHIPQCMNCDVSLTYHQFRKELRCHYCGYHESLEIGCSACGNQTINTKGLGTEQVESELQEFFPEALTRRMDYDTTRGKHSYSKLIGAFEEGEIDILVGTQMVTKGLDFRNVNLVGIMNADTLLNFPDYRSHERSFQLLTQVAGRAGRTLKQGRVIIQTYQPNHPVINQVLQGDYEAMYGRQLSEREQFRYPPVYRIIKILFKHKEYQRLREGSAWFSRALRLQFEDMVLGPEAPLIGRLRNQYIMQILLKIPQGKSLIKTKNSIKRIEHSFNAISQFRSIRVIYHADHI